MTGIDLIYAMEGIDEGFIQEARQNQHSAPTWMQGISIAACFLCILLISIFSIIRLATHSQEVTPAPVAPAETTPIAAEEDSALEESILEETAEVYSPYRIDGDTILYGNTEWGMYTDDIYERENLDSDIWSYDTREKSVLSPEYPLSEHPEVKSISYSFSWVGDNLEFGLSFTTVRYDATQISFDQLFEDRVEMFGSPATKEENRATWITSDGTELFLAGDERIISEQLSGKESVFSHGLMDVDVEAYLADLQPPGGHFGWTFQQHVDHGLLTPENGTQELIEHEDGSSDFYFHSTVELGGHTVPVDYYFGSTLATYGPNADPAEYVLKQVFVIPPEDIPFEEWLDSISDTWIRKLHENTSRRFVSPVMLSALLSEDQQKMMVDRAVSLGQAPAEELTFSNWSLVAFFYSDGVWQYNGTGAALYLTTPRP